MAHLKHAKDCLAAAWCTPSCWPPACTAKTVAPTDQNDGTSEARRGLSSLCLVHSCLQGSGQAPPLLCEDIVGQRPPQLHISKHAQDSEQTVHERHQAPTQPPSHPPVPAVYVAAVLPMLHQPPASSQAGAQLCRMPLVQESTAPSGWAKPAALGQMLPAASALAGRATVCATG